MERDTCYCLHPHLRRERLYRNTEYTVLFPLFLSLSLSLSLSLPPSHTLSLPLSLLPSVYHLLNEQTCPNKCEIGRAHV